MNRVAPALWVIYLLVPVEGWGLLSGRPLSALSAAALVAVLWLWFVQRPWRWGALAIAALAVKLSLGTLALAPHGFAAQYFANATFSGAAELGTEPTERDATRTDRRLDFGAARDTDLPMAFFNDIQRFNFYLPTDPDRATLPVSVKWDGWLDVPYDTLKRVYVRGAAKGQAQVAVGGSEPFTVALTGETATGFIRLRAGLQTLHVTLTLPQGAPREFSAGWMVNGEPRPFDEAFVYRRAPKPARIVTDRWVRPASVGIDAALLLLLCVAIGWQMVRLAQRLWVAPVVRDVAAVLLVIVGVDALRGNLPAWGRMFVLSGGDDWLTYETLARDIGLHGLWMLKGATLGHGQPFYFQPLYPYFVAGVHWLFGDALIGVFFVQRLLLGVVLIALWRLTARAFGERVGALGLVVGAVVIFEKLAPLTGLVLSELLYIPLVCVWVWLLVRLATDPAPSLGVAALTGAVGGFATLARSPLMAAWVLVLPLLLIALWRSGRAWRSALVVAVCLTAVTGLATYRNWRVSGTPVLVASSGGINFYLGNLPPKPIVIPEAHKASYARWGIDANAQTAVEFARQMPRAFFDGWIKKAQFTLGWYDAIDPALGRSMFFMVVWMLGALGVALMLVGAFGAPRFSATRLLPLAVALSHFAILVVIFPTQGDRLLLPFYLLLVPYLAVVGDAVQRAVRRVPPGATIVALVIAAGAGAGCAVKPDKDIAEARAALDAAAAAGGDRFSAAMARAREAQAALDAELQRQSRAWIKRFERVDDLAVTVQGEAATVLATAADGRARLVDDAQAGRATESDNLFQNGTFARGLDGWSVHPQADATVRVEPGAEPVWHATWRKGNWSTIYQEQLLQPDTVYIYQAWIKTTAPIVALYWQSEIGRFFNIETSYPQWTRVRYVFVTPHWNGQPYRVGFNPVLMKGAGDVWLRDLRLTEARSPR